MTGARASGPHPLLRRLFRVPVLLYRWHCGWLLGNRFMLLIHTGRRSGLQRYTVLEIAEYHARGPEAVVLSGWGRRADWLRNIAATPRPVVVIGTRRFVATWRQLEPEEAVRGTRGYEQRNRYMARIIRAVLSRLLGWRYDGSEAALRRLAEQLPFIAFRPAGSPT